MSNRKTIKKPVPVPPPGTPRIVYQPSDIEIEYIHEALAEWRSANAILQARAKEMQGRVEFIRKQRGLPENVAYHEERRAFVEVTAAGTNAS